ncbi:MAG TPA: hypothetical protein VK633_03460, partial [Verrucomicrobiae bacterium]|nr:hypothetical protein [Verrucomicrobiae bacterium]
MEEIKNSTRKVSWGKRIGIVLGVLVLLLVAAFFVVTSSAFVKAVILPKVGNALNAKVTVGDLSLSPFSQVDIRQLRVETSGSEPLLTADQARVRYSLLDIIKGNIKVDEITLIAPVINIVQEPDGSSNLDPITKGDKKEKPQSNEPTKLSVQNISIKNGTIRQVQKNKDGSISRTELQNAALDLDHLGNGQTGHLKLGSSFSMEQRQGATNNLLSGQFEGAYDLSLNQALMPDTIKGSAKLSVSRADGSFKDLAGLSTVLDADLTPKEIRQVALRFMRNDQQLGQVRISGPMDIERKEGSLKLEIASLDKNVLALATAGKGYDFGNSQLNASNHITISQAGTFFAANGNLAGTRISLAHEAMKTPEMNLLLDYQVTVNTSDKSAVLQRLNLSGEYGGKNFLRSQLDRQMNLSWGETVKGYKDAALQLLVTNFNIAEWRAVMGTNVTDGTASATISL